MKSILFTAIGRVMKLTGIFVGYQIVKTGLWHYGYFAHFFHKTKYMSIPLYILGVFGITGPMAILDMKSVDLWDYYEKRARHINHTKVVD